ncbi:MAG: carbohydrate ABC transporter permease [Treponema sp.]|nr:carbohydrate ABC transporter permease [Treponema sp.]
MEKPKTVRLTTTDKIFYGALDTYLVLLFFIIAIPMWSTITLSFKPQAFLGSNFELMFNPIWKWSVGAYRALIGNNGFILAFRNSLLILVLGVFWSLFLTIPMAYCMSVKTLPGRKILNVFVLIPYLFNIGMIPTYLVITKTLHLTDTLWAVVMPGALSTYNCLIMRNFFDGIPESLKESARIDGAAEWRVLVSIIMPLSKPIILTIGLYYGVNFWNDYFHPMLYINKTNLQPLPILLRNILIGSGMNEVVEVNAFGNAPIESIKAASVFMSAIPMVLAYPFIQKYFTKGTMLGGVKG